MLFIMGRRNWFYVLGVISLTFFGIPLRIKKNLRNSNSDELLFSEYVIKFNKTYLENETEYFIRMENFKQSLRLIDELNQNRSSNASALYGLTVFSDLSQEEFKELRLQNNKSKFNIPFENLIYQRTQYLPQKKKLKWKYIYNQRLKRALVKLPPATDWRKKNVVGLVQNQKNCGACWAFSTIETIESMNAIKNGSFLPLSVQEAIDCARYGNYGCEGGDSCALLKWLVLTKTKLIPEKIYPFAYHTQHCKLRVPEVGVQVKSYSCDNFVGDEDELLQKLAHHGPVAAAVNALNWQFYLGGIIQFHCSGSPEHMNHAVQIVGYNKIGPIPYYIVRNSWGKEFGDDGYLYIAIGENICGIANEISSLDVF